ncbi:hypothetical protein MTR_7g012010 [Medicago truncatula]|uniref:Uncharacterized protein n=1 Tax=Medicago truncatula TaxID=3880 RepID=G7L361_MEDTR|nr:hypothetical protein MTR_7g012010 [Medicago truncatula]
MVLRPLKYSVETRVGNRPGRPTGAYGLACLSLAWPGLFIKKARLRSLRSKIELSHEARRAASLLVFLSHGIKVHVSMFAGKVLAAGKLLKY